MQGSSQPSVCVIIAAYNAESTIARAVASALAEPEVAEVIVIDDASIDHTIAVAQSCDDGSGRLRILAQTTNGGPSAARNRAIAESSSPWIAILDADDFFLPGRIRALMAHSARADMIADDIWQVPEENIDGPRRSLMGSLLFEIKYIGFSEFVLSNVSRAGRDRRELGFIKPLMRRAFLDAHCIRYQSHMRLGEDFELYARALAAKGRLLLIPVQGYVSVMRANSLSRQHSINDLVNLRDCNKRLLASFNFSPLDKNALQRHYVSVDCRLQWRLLIVAVKTCDIKAILLTFLGPYQVPAYLFKQLAQQAYERCKVLLTPTYG